MATNTVYIPIGLELDPSKVEGYGQGVFDIGCAANSTTNLDLTLTDDVIITGLELITYGASIGDYVVMQILAGAVVVKTPLPGPWYVSSNADQSFSLAFPMKIVAGLTIRVVVHTTVLLVTPGVAVNYKLWKVLV